jgi:RNA polymerase sigma-70 factor (ECF subfamily)
MPRKLPAFAAQRMSLLFAMPSIDTVQAHGYALLMQTATERLLMNQARDGEEQAFTQLVEAHSEKIIALAWRMVGARDVAEDIAQEAFIRLFKSLSSFRGESSVGTWLYRTVTRLAIDHLRREQLRRKIFFFRNNDPDQIDPVELAVAPSASPHELLQAQQTGDRMQKVLNALPPRQKAIFVLRQMEGLQLKEIAILLGLQEGTVKAHLHRAVTQFRKELCRGEEEVP